MKLGAATLRLLSYILSPSRPSHRRQPNFFRKGIKGRFFINDTEKRCQRLAYAEERQAPQSRAQGERSPEKAHQKNRQGAFCKDRPPYSKHNHPKPQTFLRAKQGYP